MKEECPVGSTSRVMKTCRVCGKIKWYTEFRSKGGAKNHCQPYCRECGTHKWKSLKTKKLNIYNVDMLALGENIRVRSSRTAGVFFKYSIPFERAVRMVQERMAFILHEHLIKQRYSMEDFVLLVCERARYTCQNCGNPGSVVGHIVPMEQGGITSFGNCRCLCFKCAGSSKLIDKNDFLYIEKMNQKKFHKKRYPTIGATCNLLKKCSICEKEQWHKEFQRKGGKGNHARRSVCRTCRISGKIK